MANDNEKKFVAPKMDILGIDAVRPMVKAGCQIRYIPGNKMNMVIWYHGGSVTRALTEPKTIIDLFLEGTLSPPDYIVEV
jgi:hypothetical protein